MLMKKILVILLSVLMMLLSVSSLFAASSWDKYKFADFTSERINKLTPLMNGNMAVCREGGGLSIIKSNGGEKTYTKGNSGLSNNYLTGCTQDKSGNIWIGTNLGLDVLSVNGISERISEHNSNIFSDEITAVAIANDGKLWAGMKQLGLTYRNDNKEWTRISSFESGLPSNDIRKLVFDDENNLYLAMYPMINQGGGFAILKNNGSWVNYNVKNSELPDDRVNDFIVDSQKGIWFATEAGIAHIDAGGQWEVYNEDNTPLTTEKITAVTIDKNNNIWFSTWGSGIVCFNNISWSVYNKSNTSMDTNYINDVELDSKGTLWVATNGGAYTYSPSEPQELNLEVIEVFYNNNKVAFDVEPYIENGTTLVPVRQIVEAMKIIPVWNPNTRTVALADSKMKIQLTIDKNIALVNGQPYDLGVPASIKSGRTFVPLRFVSELFDNIVKWDGKTRTIYINSSNNR